MAQRRRHVQILTLERRLADEAKQLRAEAKNLPGGRFETANLKPVIFSDREQVPVV